MRLLVGTAGVALVLLTLRDAFETVILPRSVVRLLRLSRTINAVLWPFWNAAASRARTDARRERYRSFYGPLSVILMLAIWAATLVVSFALVGWGLHSPWRVGNGQPATFVDDVYVSGTTLFTLGLGDVVPNSRMSEILIVSEAGIGLGFLTVSVAYLPVIYQSFSRRETQITLLDAWAGSPPSAIELIRRLTANDALPELQPFLQDWERWTADVLESHISYPQIAYFRSQHGRQSWVSSLATILDVSALVLAGPDGVARWRARQTFAITRHAVVDLCQVLNVAPRKSPRWQTDPVDAILTAAEGAGLRFPDRADAARQLTSYRKMYEPYVSGLSAALWMDLPRWVREGVYRDNWEASPKREIELHL